MSYRMGRPFRAARVVLGALVGAVLLIASAVPAGAHTALEASSPKDGGRIGVAPGQLVLKFTEAILTTGARVAVQGPDGRTYQSGAAQVIGDKLTQSLKPLGPAGEYQVEFRIVADDGHPLTGGMRFRLTKPGPAAGGSKAVTQPAPLAAVSSNPANDAPPWVPWIAGAAVAACAAGAVLFGRRVTRGLD